MKKYLASSLVALALTASSMSAATITAGVNDLVLGFRATGATQGNASNLEVDLGNISTFTTLAAGSTIDFSSRLSATDITATYGAFNRTTLQFGIAGTTGSAAGGSDGQAASTVWLSNTSGVLATVAGKYGNNTSGLNIPAGKIGSLYNASPASLNGATSTANSNFAAVETAATAGSFAATATSAFDFGTGATGLMATSATSGIKTLYLYQVQPNDANGVTGTGVALVGSFAFDTASGGLVYTSAGLNASAIPEPSTYAALAGAAVLGFVALRRRQARVA